MSYADYAKSERVVQRGLESDLPILFLSLPTEQGTPPFYYGDWIGTTNTSIVYCNDGLRLVIFKFETTDEKYLLQGYL